MNLNPLVQTDFDDLFKALVEKVSKGTASVSTWSYAMRMRHQICVQRRSNRIAHVFQGNGISREQATEKLLLLP
jgi:hypothetical protein